MPLSEHDSRRTNVSVSSETTTPRERDKAWVAYVAPMAIFMGITALEGPLSAYYPYVYAAKAVVVAAALIACRSAWSDIRFSASATGWGVVVGAVVLVEWLVVKNPVDLNLGGARTAYNPFIEIGGAGAIAFIAVRLVGLAVIVPVMEELFWRSFLLRYVTKPAWRDVPLKQFSWGAFAFVCVLFALAHPEWMAALICAAAYGLLLRKTGSVYACIVAHATTNLGLGIYVLTTGAWRFW